jgi:hypothetical protein
MRGKQHVSGVALKVTAEIVGRLRDIRALWAAAYNDPQHTIEELAPEFFDKVGAILEGRSLASLTYYLINKERALQYAEGL